MHQLHTNVTKWKSCLRVKMITNWPRSFFNLIKSLIFESIKILTCHIKINTSRPLFEWILGATFQNPYMSILIQILFCGGKLRNLILFPWIYGINLNIFQGIGCWLIGFEILFLQLHCPIFKLKHLTPCEN
jgi:hypothetical protein